MITVQRVNDSLLGSSLFHGSGAWSRRFPLSCHLACKFTSLACCPIEFAGFGFGVRLTSCFQVPLGCDPAIVNLLVGSMTNCCLSMLNMVDNESPRVRLPYSILEKVARLPLMVDTIVRLYSLDFMFSCHWIPSCNSRNFYA